MPSDANVNENEPDAIAGFGAGDEGKMNSELETQVSKLREDVAGVAEALKSLATERADGAKRQAFALRDDVRNRGEQYVRQAQEVASDFEDQVSERVRAEPIKAVLIAAAVGYFYARIFH